MTYVELSKPLLSVGVSLEYYSIEDQIKTAATWVQSHVVTVVENPYWRLAIDIATLLGLGYAIYSMIK